MLENTVIIVSGLPRSGTSMMMQVLQAGGLPLLTDRMRRPDTDNPKGYYEYDPVRKLESDHSWLDQARGRAVKIVAPLLPLLPPEETFQYRVLFMERSLPEIIASQNTMMERRGKEVPDIPEERLLDIFQRQVRQIKEMLANRAIPTHMVDHREAIENPGETVRRVNRFLGGVLKETAMAAAIDPGLYRRKAI